MCSKYPGMKFEPAFQRWDKIETLLSSAQAGAQVVYLAGKHVISRRGKHENVSRLWNV